MYVSEWGNDTEECLTQPTIKHCKTISFILQHVEDISEGYVIITALPGSSDYLLCEQNDLLDIDLKNIVNKHIVIEDGTILCNVSIYSYYNVYSNTSVIFRHILFHNVDIILNDVEILFYNCTFFRVYGA